LYKMAARTARAATTESNLRKRALVSQRSRSGSSTGQDDSTAPILATL
jgi:hypothetical protein